MGNFGFSYIGLIYLLMLFIPNSMWASRKPKGYSADGETRILRGFERVGQVLCTACALMFSDYNPSALSPWTAWLAVSFALMVLYEFYWLRYFRGAYTLADFYRSFCGIPLPGATLPVVAFLLLGVYGRVVWMVISAVILGIGHIGIHAGHRNGNFTI